MANKNMVALDELFIEEVKRARKEKKFTQDDMARMLDISNKKYSRIETHKMTNVERDIVKNMASILDIQLPDSINQFGCRISFTASSQLRNDIEYLKLSKGFSTISDTIKYCIEEVMNDFFMRKVSLDITEDIKEVIGMTYNKELDKLALQNEIDEILLDKLNSERAVDINKSKSVLEEFLLKVNRAKKY